jgi:hypothetical protein
MATIVGMTGGAPSTAWSAADAGKLVLDLEIDDRRGPRDDIDEQAAQFRDVPLAIAQLVEGLAHRLVARSTRRLEERPTCALYGEAFIRTT